MDSLLLVFKGFLIGLSVLIPGVSGGTMAIVLGIYDDLIHAISSFLKNKRKSFFLLVKVGAGALLGMVLFSKLIAYGLERFRFPMIYMFLGFVVGGIPVLAAKTKTSISRKRDYIFCVAGFAIAFLMMATPPEIMKLSTQTDVFGILFLLVAGFIIAVALILPGISTSFMLLTLGMYDTILEAIQTLNLFILIPVLIGVAVGTVSTTKILENVMHKYPRKTYLLILGFVLGSVLQVFPGIPKQMDILYSVLTFAFGVAAIRLLNKYSS